MSGDLPDRLGEYLVAERDRDPHIGPGIPLFSSIGLAVTATSIPRDM